MSFTMNVKVSSSKFEEAKKKIVDNGGSVSGNQFSVKGVKGSFSREAGSMDMEIRITDKPWLASENMIRKEIREFFS